ncbi:MAG TPA: bifunctional serine/threonine-protein kinase/formylglycine-generating enzyme family protein [Dokdonella sp.]|uniref:bifunctional serine/threonine-protein kinase/formylglycine-generating enzyme family protein n=1 Tax=Dokdonella sp. TaxID=2291710 RepID=UPI002C2B278D|nr:bifunctional serine/threonine-protein kinase/formylglycine-generating enzyme family protein [Dokdonella sp.]HUD42616.1 bifunctional serine/threonine-protein kinase/formylglycine-generating enzyme family protein [Dokdonella sp.]
MATIDIPDYRPVDKLGSSRLASVRLATQTSLERDVALKILSPGPAADPDISEQFLQSARTLASFAHPNVVQVYDIGLEPAPYYAMQYLSGGNLASRVRRGLDERELRRILESVARALGYIHRRRHVHGSISPNNILFDANDTAILSDFGLLAARRKLAAEGDAAPAATDGYVGPEVARGDAPDARSDIYSLGAVAFFGLSGRSPAEAGDAAPSVPRLPPERAHWQPLLDKAMAADPNKRFQSAEALLAALASIDVTAGEGAAAPALPPKIPSAPPPAPVVAASASAAVAGSAPDGHVAPASHGDAPAPPGAAADGAWLPIAIAALGVLLIGGVGYGLWASRAPSSQPALSASVPDPIELPEPLPADPAEPPAAAPAEPDFLSDPRLDAEGRPIAPIDLRLLPTVVDPVAELVRLGRADLAAQRLTLPPERNALERFQLALKINPRTRAAREGIAQVARGYLDLAENAHQAGQTDAFLEQLDKAGTVGALAGEEGKAVLAQIRERRSREAARLIEQARPLVEAWDKAGAGALYERALAIDPGNAAVLEAQRRLQRVGAPGYVFRDAVDGGSGPSLVVLDATLAVGQFPVTRGEFARWAQAAGDAAQGAQACRDRESFFRSSRNRSWLKPDLEQGDDHPVVCVGFAQAQRYAAWLSERTGQRYRLLTPAEWDRIARSATTADCRTANLADQAYRRRYETQQGQDCDDGAAGTSPVGRYPSISVGVFDIDGNVREWVAGCGKGAPLKPGCREHTVKGRGWLSMPGKEAVGNVESYGEDVALNSVGFRIAREIAP